MNILDKISYKIIFAMKMLKYTISYEGSIFGEGVRIYDHNHRFSNYVKPIIEQGYNVKSVHIGENCWIGSNCVILPGANIQSDSIIGAGCVISEDIPRGMIVTSNRELHYKQRRRNDGSV